MNVLVVTNNDFSNRGVLVFDNELAQEEFREKLQETVKDFMTTYDGQAAKDDMDGSFTWDMVVERIGKGFFAKHGLHLTADVGGAIIVDGWAEPVPDDQTAL